MSAYGLQILGQSNEYLINSGWTNLHFAGQATYSNTSSRIYSHNSNMTYVTWILNYTITLNNNTAAPLPFFSLPKYLYYSVSTYGIEKTGNQTWRIQMLVYNQGANQSYDSECPADHRPNVYVFCEPGGAATAGNYGMQVFNDLGIVTFDSTKRPLMVDETASVTPSSVPVGNTIFTQLPKQPLNNFAKYGENGRYIDIQSEINTTAWQDNFLSLGNGGRRSVTQLLTQRQSLPIYMYSPASLACRVVQTQDYQAQTQGGFIGIGESEERKWWETNYWTQYRTAIRKLEEESSYIILWWVPIAQNIYYWGRELQGGSWLSFNDAEAGTVNHGGIYPHETASTNVTSQPIIIANGDNYSTVAV